MPNHWEPFLDALFEASDAARPTTPDRPTRSGGQVPTNDIRLTINIKKRLHQKLKVRAAQRGETIGEMIEAWIQTLN